MTSIHSSPETSSAPAGPAGPADPVAAALRDARAEAAGGKRLWGIPELAPYAPPRPSRFPRLRCGPAVFARAADDEEFRRRFRAAAPGLSGFDFEGSGLVLAGGAPLALLSGPGAIFDDLDLFFVGDGPAGGAEASLALLARYLYAAWEGELEVYRTEQFITFRDPASKTRVQVVLFRYASAADLLYDFDLGGVAFDGRRVWLSAFGRLAAESGLLTPNWPSARESLSSRIVKYLGRGFSVLLPELDPAALAEHPTLRLDGLVWQKGGEIRAASISATGPAAAYRAVPYGCPLVLAALNLCKPERACAFAHYSPGLPLSIFPVRLVPKDLIRVIEGDVYAAASVVAAFADELPSRALVLSALREAQVAEAHGLACPALEIVRAKTPKIPFAVEPRGFGLGPFGRGVGPRAWYGGSFAEYFD